jgi:hypothetical protein
VHVPHCIAICGLSDSGMLFPHYLINDTVFGEKKKFELKMFVLMFCTTFVCKTVLISIQRHITINVLMSWPKYSLLSEFSQSWIFSTDFRKILRYQISWKSVQWKLSCSMLADGQADRHDEANSRLSQFCERAWKAERATNLKTNRERRLSANAWVLSDIPCKPYAPPVLPLIW